MPWSISYLNTNDAAWKNDALSPKLKEIIISISNRPRIRIDLIFYSTIELYNFNKKNSSLNMNKTNKHTLQLETSDHNLIRCLFYATNDLDHKIDETPKIAEFINIDLSLHAEDILAFIQKNVGNFEQIFTFAEQSADDQTLWRLAQHCDTTLTDTKKAIICYKAVPKKSPYFQAANLRIVEILTEILSSEQSTVLTEDEIKIYLDLQFKCKLNLVANEKTQQDFDQYYHELSGGVSGSTPSIQNVGPNPETLMKFAENTKRLKKENVALKQDLTTAQAYTQVLEIQIRKLTEQLSTTSFNGSTYQRFVEANLIDLKASNLEQPNPSLTSTDVVISINDTVESEVTPEPIISSSSSIFGFK